jgi:glutamate transport system permease protein
MNGLPFFDEPSRTGRRTLALCNYVGAAVLLLLFGWVAWQLHRSGQVRPELWAPFLEPGVWRTIGRGLLATIRAAIFCIVLSVVLGAVLGIARLSPNRVVRAVVGLWVEFFRAIPSLLVILFFFLAYSRPFGWLGSTMQAHLPIWLSVLLAADQWKTLGPLVLAIVLQHSAIIAEVFRGGVLAVPRGQSEAGIAMGMTRAELLRIVLLPQAIRGMTPTLVSECVRSLKATALGYAIGYLDLLRTGQIIASAYHNIIPMALILTAVYVAICLPLSSLAEWLERRSSPLRKKVERARPASTGARTLEGATT